MSPIHITYVLSLPASYEPVHADFNEASFVSYAKSKGILHTAGGVDYFVWNNNANKKKLFHGAMPPFIRGKSKCKALLNDRRLITITLFSK
jgi:hypothetical protein